MKTVLITGAKGFIGKNLVAHLNRLEDVEILEYDAENTLHDLEELVQRAQFVFHLAGVTHPDDSSAYDSVNRGFTEMLLEILEGHGSKAPVLMTSSIQALFDNPYGTSKAGAEHILLEYAQRTGVKTYVYRLPTVFGKWCRPNYNSVVASFCHNMARSLPIQIDDPVSKLELVYIDDVIDQFVRALYGEVEASFDGFCYIYRTFTVTLQQLADRINAYADSRKSLVVPSFEEEFDRCLYATYLSYLPESGFGYNLEIKHDNAGWLAEFIKSKSFGQISISRTKPGITYGNHWHNTKVEKFLVIEGEAVIKLRHIDSNEVIDYRVSGQDLKVVDIPVGYTHSMTNVGESDVITLLWSDQIFNDDKPDTYSLSVTNLDV